MATADPARRASFATAAETLIAQNRTTLVVGPLTTVGLIVSIVMLKGVFPKTVAYLGVATGVLRICAEALGMVFEGFYVIYGVRLPIWMGAVGWNLYRLGRISTARAARTRTAGGGHRGEKGSVTAAPASPARSRICD